MPVLTQFTPDAERLGILKDCIDNYDVGEDESAEWPNNILSRRTVVYGNGTIARANDEVSFAVDSDELDMCVRLANEAAALMDGEVVGMDSKSSVTFSAFWIGVNSNDKAEHIDENLIRARFGGTIFPPATIKIGPISSDSEVFGGQVREYFSEAEEDDSENAVEVRASLARWDALVHWFESQNDFRETAWIEMGDAAEFQELPEEQLPPGTEMTPGVLPRLMLGLTQNGSLCGLFGFVVQT